ncbi:MAG: UvrD-helicase domain-containing protein, partial [Rikenellaceae bacterium]
MKASIYNASAGSGKTYRLAYKYVRDVIEEPMLYRNILAVTFTNKATEEMKRRILKQIHTLAAALPSSYMEQLQQELGLTPAQIQYRALEARTLILHNYSRFTVLTIDKFFQRLLRAFIQELGIDIDYSLEIDNSPIVTQSADALIEQITTDSTLRKWLMELVQERIDDGRKWNIRDAILALKEELFKEQARESLESSRPKEELREMIERMNRESNEIISQIRKIATQAMQTITSAGMSCNDFKGKGSSLAQVFRKIVESKRELIKLTDAQRNNCSNIDKWCSKEDDRAVANQVMPLLCQIVELYSSGMKHINTSKLLSENYRSFALMYDLYHKTQEICREQNTMLLSQTSHILEEFIRESDAPFIYEKVGNRYSHFMIDEFQDTSRREWNNFIPLLRDTISQCEPSENRILIVGDIKQSIYRWRGGDWRILHSDVERELGHYNTEMINMVDNYRSLPNIVRFNNEIISNIVDSENRVLNEELSAAYTENRIGKGCRDELYQMVSDAYNDHTQNPKREGEGYVEVATYKETPPTISKICEAIDNRFKPCDIMILTRSNREASMVAETLLEFKQRNREPKYRFDVMTQEALIVGYAPVSRFIIATLHLSLNVEDGLQRAIYNRFLGRDYIDTELTEREVEFLHQIRLSPPIEALESIVMEYRIEQDRSNIAYIQAIHDQIITYSKSKIGDIALFLEWWHEKGATQSLRVERSEEAIEILTIHKAKGLEKKVVIIPYCNWDQNPKTSGVNKNFVWAERESDPESKERERYPIEYKRAMEESDFAEEYYRERVYTRIDNINTLYVALTRAVEILYICVKLTEKGVARGVGDIILQSLPEGCVKAEGDEGLSFRYSVPSSPRSEHSDDEMAKLQIMDSYESSPTDLRLRLPSRRYTEDGASFAPREVGILMHRAFEQSASYSEVVERVGAMLTMGLINSEEQ